MTSRRYLPSLAILLFLAFALAGRSEPAQTRVAILVYDGVYNTEFIAPLDVFNHAGFHSGGRIEVFTVAPRPGPVTSAEGLRISPQYSFATAPQIDWLVVPSGKDYRRDAENQTLLAWVRSVGRRAKVVHSNCWGAFLLAAAGLLDGKQATTYPASLAEFAQRFPAVKLRRDQYLVDDDGVVTSAGGVVSYDAALYLVEKYFGPELARKVATGLVIDWDARRSLYRGIAARSKP